MLNTLVETSTVTLIRKETGNVIDALMLITKMNPSIYCPSNSSIKGAFFKIVVGHGKLLFSNQYWLLVILKLPPDDVNGLLEPGLTSLEP